MKKRIIAVMMAIIMSMALTACGSKDSGSDPGNSVDADTSVTGKVVIYTSMYEDIIDEIRLRYATCPNRRSKRKS